MSWVVFLLLSSLSGHVGGVEPVSGHVGGVEPVSDHVGGVEPVSGHVGGVEPVCREKRSACSCMTDKGLIDLSPLDSGEPGVPRYSYMSYYSD